MYGEEYLSRVELTPLLRSDIRFLIKNLTLVKGSMYYRFYNRNRLFSRIDTTISNVKMMLDNGRN